MDKMGERNYLVAVTVATYEEAIAVANHMGELDREIGTDCHIEIGPSPVGFVKPLTKSGSGLGVHVDRPVTDALDLVRGDLVLITIRRA